MKDRPTQRERRVVVALMDATFVLQPVRMASELLTDLQDFIQTVANVQSSSATMQLITDVKLEPSREVIFSKIAHYCAQMCTLYSHKRDS